MFLLRRIRIERGLTTQDVANSVDHDRSSISNVETGKTTPGKQLARGLYREFNGEVPLAAIYDAEFYEEIESGAS